MKRMRARGPRDTHTLVQMVRAQLNALVGATGRVAGAVDTLRVEVTAMTSDVNALAKMVGALAEISEDHEDRITELEKSRP